MMMTTTMMMMMMMMLMSGKFPAAPWGLFCCCCCRCCWPYWCAPQCASAVTAAAGAAAAAKGKSLQASGWRQRQAGKICNNDMYHFSLSFLLLLRCRCNCIRGYPILVVLYLNSVTYTTTFKVRLACDVIVDLFQETEKIQKSLNFKFSRSR
jgi:hypothetical protein